MERKKSKVGIHQFRYNMENVKNSGILQMRFLRCAFRNYFGKMKKWQARQKQRAHQSIVENAKSTIRRYSNSKQQGLSSSRSKNTSANKQLPINKILQIFELEQYAFLLAEYGFPHKLIHHNSRQYIEEMLCRVDDFDQQRFLSLLNTLTVMSKDIKRPVKTPNVLRSKKSTNFPPQSVSTSKQTPPSLQKSEKTASKFRIKNNCATNHRENPLLNRSKKPPKCERQKTLTNKYNRKKSVSYSRPPAQDDFSVIHDFESGSIHRTVEGNHLIKRLVQKLGVLEENKQGKSCEEIELNLQQIKEMYKSFDSGKITSNISNIDLQLMIDCLSHEIFDQLQLGNISMMAKGSQEKIKALLQQSFLLLQDQKTESTKKQQNSHEIVRISKKKNIEEDFGMVDQVEINEEISQKNFDPGSLQIYEEERPESALDEEYDTDKSEGCCSIDMAEMNKNESSIWGNSYIQSIINDFSCFDKAPASETSENKTQRVDIKNFIELVVMAGKMEKEIPIIAHVYLKRLLKMTKSKGGRITQKNWRNITLIVLIEASKIWDDQSLQNHSFSKIVKPYTTLQINRLQKYLLFFIDYSITINQKQYSDSYFQLRKHTPHSHSTANLMKLDIKTIQKLQNTKAKSHQNKQQFLKRCMNKSF